MKMLASTSSILLHHCMREESNFLVLHHIQVVTILDMVLQLLWQWIRVQLLLLNRLSRLAVFYCLSQRQLAEVLKEV
jgi:hypothetical protein